MDQAETVRYLKLNLKLSRYLAISPYSWSDEKKVEFAGKSSPRYFAFIAQLLLYIAYESFLVARWIYALRFDPNATVKEKSGLQYVAISYSIPLVYHLCSFFHVERLHLFINRLILYQRGTLNRKIAFGIPFRR